MPVVVGDEPMAAGVFYITDIIHIFVWRKP